MSKQVFPQALDDVSLSWVRVKLPVSYDDQFPSDFAGHDIACLCVVFYACPALLCFWR